MAKKKEEEILLLQYKAEELPVAVGAVGELQREKEKITLDFDSRIAALQTELSEKTDGIDKEIKQISKSIKYFMDANKKDYISEKKKTLTLETGEISYRGGKPSVKTKNSEKLIIEILEKNNLLKSRDSFVKKMHSVFVRVKCELDKELALANPTAANTVAGIEIEEGAERFYIKPYSTSTELEVA